MGFDVATGQSSTAADPALPLQASGSGISAVGGVTPVAGQLTPADQGGVFDAAGQQADIMASGEAAVAAAQAAGMDARDAALAHYQAQALPLGGQLGDNLVMPVVADNAVVPASSDDYPWPGDEPMPSSAGPTYHGNEPT